LGSAGEGRAISSLGAFADEGKRIPRPDFGFPIAKSDFLIADQMLHRRGASRRPLCCSIGGVDFCAAYLGSIQRFQLGFFEYLSEETRDAIDDQQKAQEE